MPGFAIARLRYSLTPSALLTHLTHTVHGHTVQGGTWHGTLFGGGHHGQHGHTVSATCGLVPHVPGHSPGGATEAPTYILPADFWAVVSDEAKSGGQPSVARRGGLVHLFTQLSDALLRPAAGDGLRRTWTVPDVRVGGVPAEVVFSGLAPTGLNWAWQISLRIPESTDLGNAVPIEVTIDGRNLRAAVSIAE